VGSAGESAHREYERRHAAKEAMVKAKLGSLMGAVALAVQGDEQSTLAWERGAVGEQQLAAVLAGVAGVRVLNDRRVPGTRGNIDHLVIGPPGVFVVDAKNYHGTIRIRDRGTVFARADRLYVGGRDRSKLAENMGWQVEAVKRVLESVSSDLPAVHVQPVLCFIDGEWPLLTAPTSYKGVRLEGTRSIRDLVGRGQLLNPQQIERLTRSLSVAFPAK
jgi:hypothetical protein